MKQRKRPIKETEIRKSRDLIKGQPLEQDRTQSESELHLSDTSEIEPGTYVNPFTDFGFKRIFGQELSSDILIDFLNEVLAGKESTITSVTYLNNEHQPEQKDQRRAAFDLHCKTSTGARIIVEMQAGYQRHIVERSLYYAARVIGEQAPRGEWDFNYDRIYSIAILDFKKAESFSSSEVRHEGMILNTETSRPITDRLVLIFLEMRNFVKTERQLETRMDKWLYLLRNLSQLTRRPKALQERIFNKIFTIAKVSAMDTKEYTDYQLSLKAYRDLRSSEMSIYGLGIEKGIEKGMTQGIAKMVRSLQQNNLSVEEIVHLTSLTEAEIREILNT